MTVLQIGPYPPPHGGVQTNLVAIRDYLRAHGHSAPVINLTRFRRLMVSSRWLMLLSYVLFFLLVPLMPQVFSRFVDRIAVQTLLVTKTGITKSKAEAAVETVFESMKKALATGDRIELRGFGVFNVRPRKTGIGRNPRTGAEVSIPPGKAVRFKPGKELQSID